MGRPADRVELTGQFDQAASATGGRRRNTRGYVLARRLLLWRGMKPSSITIVSLALLAGCQVVPASTFSRHAGGGTAATPTTATASASGPGDAAAAEESSAGGDLHPELAFVAGVRSPHPSVRLVNLAADPDPDKDLDQGALESYCPDPTDGEYEDLRTSPNLPDLTGKSLDEAVAVLAQLGRYCVIVDERTSCDGPVGTPLVCHQSSQSGLPALDIDVPITLSLQTDVSARGTDHESHRVPVLKARPTDEVRADLAARGFTNVQVVADAQCERGYVCWADPDPDDFQALTESVILHVRK